MTTQRVFLVSSEKPGGFWLSRDALMFFLMLGALLFLNIGSAVAQSSGLGTISGTVTDTSGAVISGAKLSVANMATGVGRDSVTNNTGYFEVNALTPGKYKILVSSAGFKD